MSTNTNSKIVNLSSSTRPSNKSNSIPESIELCIHEDENYALHMMRKLFSLYSLNSLNAHDEFGCNVLMYSLRFQRYRLFRYLLNEKSFDVNLRAKDQLGNTIVHYAILYGGHDTQIIDQLIEKYTKFSINIDERNIHGFTPLLLAIFCGRYDIVLSLLSKTDASPFVRDYIEFKSMFDYIEIDVKTKNFSNQWQNKKSSVLNSELKRLRLQFHQCIPTRQDIFYNTIQSNTNKNFFEMFLPQMVQNQLDLLRATIMAMHDFESSSNNLKSLLNYLNRRYPRIKNFQLVENSPSTAVEKKFLFQRENSKTNIHYILNLFDPNPRSKIIQSEPNPQNLLSSTKPSITFKRLGTKVATLNAFSRAYTDKKPPLTFSAGGK